MKEGSLIQKIRSGKGILEPIGGKFNLDKADPKNYPQFTGNVEHWVWIKREMKNRCELDGCSRALFGGADGKKYVPSGNMDKTVFENQKKFMFEVFDVRWKKGKARTIIMKHWTTKNVYQIWAEILAYYDDSDRLSQLVVALSMKVQHHEFVSAHKGLEYVENIEALCQDLEDLGDLISDATKRVYFEKGTRNREYQTAIEHIIPDKSKSYHDITEAVELFHNRHMDLRQTSRNTI